MRRIVLFLLFASPLAAQSLAQQQFISGANNQIRGLISTLGNPTRPVIFGANLAIAQGSTIASMPLDALLNYVDGLKKAGAQRIEFNPGVASLSDPAITAKYDALVQRIRQLGLRLAINPEFVPGELGAQASFQQFQTAALAAYPQLAARYQPDNFVIVHDPTTEDGRMGLLPNIAGWHNFIVAVAPLIKTASPNTRVGAGGYLHGYLPELSLQENAYWMDFVRISALDFVTMDVYNIDGEIPQDLVFWSNLAHTNKKGVYIGETWAPHFLSTPLPPGSYNSFGYLSKSLDDLAIVGPCDASFATLDANWIQAMSMFASFYGMESVTAFTTHPFFALGTTGHNKPSDSGYVATVLDAVRQGKLTTIAAAFQNWSKQLSVPAATSISSASYATFPGPFGANADATVAPDELVSVFGAKLATATAVTSSATFPTTLGGTSMTMVDSAGISYDVSLYSVSPAQLNYLVPAGVKAGPATITVKSSDGTLTSGIVLVATVAPGLYTASADGKGTAAAIAVTAHADGTQSSQSAAQPIALGSAGDTVVLELFGTGIRHVSSLATVSAQIAGQSVPVLYAGEQGGYTGLDQINLQIPRSLAGSGTVSVVVTVQGVATNAVTISIQ